MPNPDAHPLLELAGVTKRFGGVTALDQVNFQLERGEIHALLGENGAGKSTLIKILAGIHQADFGQIRLEGRPIELRRVADANQFGIRVIHQELSLAPNLSVAENIFLGREPRHFGILQRRKMRANAAALIEDLGMSEIKAVDTPVAALNVAHQQLVEIARALSGQARILILDEPTSALSLPETEALFATLKRLRSAGVGIVYISHRLEEIIRLADRVTVLRDGRNVGTQVAGALNQSQLIQWMVGREIANYFHRPPHRHGAPALEVNHLQNARVRDVSFTLHQGEILGLAGLVGAGRSELARAIFGVDPLAAGDIRVHGERARIQSPHDARRVGIVLVPEDRRKEGLVMIPSTAFNLALPWVADWNRGFAPDYRRRAEIVRRAIQDFAIKVTDPEQGIGVLSGGNQQKVMVGRWMERRPRILILDEPTRGIDVGAREEMFRLIGGLVEGGMAVLFISSDLAEVLQMSHRVAIYREGTIRRIAPAESVTAEEVMGELTGANPHASH